VLAKPEKQFYKFLKFKIQNSTRMGSTFLKLAILSDDPFALLLASEEIRRRKTDNRPKFIFENYEAPRFVTDFRFTKEEILRLVAAFEVPAELKTEQGQKFLGLEGRYNIHMIQKT
jgi:hypothetical protein